MSGYAPTTVNLYEIYYVVDDDQIVDVWPIRARYGSDSVGQEPVVSGIAPRLAARSAHS